MVKRQLVLVVAVAGLLTVAVAQQADTQDAAEPDDAATTPTTVIDELSQAEIEAELARAEKVLDDPDEVKEYTDDTPLPADLPLALPSDF
jgi:predicted outer membrane protein